MSKKHQHKISKKKTRQRANRSWRRQARQKVKGMKATAYPTRRSVGKKSIYRQAAEEIGGIIDHSRDRD